MTARRRPSTLRHATARLAVAGAAGLATVMASVPMAVADDLAPATTEPVQDETTDTTPPAGPGDEAPAPAEEAPPAPPQDAPVEPPVDEVAPVDEDTPLVDEVVPEADGTLPGEPAPVEAVPEAPAPAATDEAAEPQDLEVAADFGGGKIRVGVRIADGSYVPAGTTSAGSVLTITFTTSTGEAPSSIECTTFGSGPETECQGPQFGLYPVPDGATVTVTQETAAPGLTRSTAAISPTCDDEGCNTGSAFITNTGPLPVTTPDAVVTSNGQPVTIDVLANDTSDDPSTSLSIDSAPAGGTAVVTGAAAPLPPVVVPPVELPDIDALADQTVGAAAVAGAGTLRIVYTPRAGYSGTDTFRYAVTNSNGTTTGTVSVRVRRAAVVAPPTKEPRDTDDADASDGAVADASVAVATTTLPDTGGVDARLFGYAALLISGGGALTVASRRRPRRSALVD